MQDQRYPFLLAALIACLIVGTSQAGGLTATVKQRVHPILIQKPYNCLMHVVLEVAEAGIQVTAIDISLRGSDDLRDFESLRMLYAGNNQLETLDRIFSGTRFKGDRRKRFKQMSNAFGRRRPASQSITFRGKQELKKGTNVFWLSCRMRGSANLGHRVDASCISITTSKGIVKPKDESKKIRKRIGVALRRFRQDGIHTSRIPALATTPKGTLLCVFDMRRRKRRDLQEDIDIGLHRSTDGGQTWKPIQVIMDMGTYGGLPQEQNGCSDPGIIVDRNTGEIFCGAVWMWGRPGKHQWDADGSEKGFEIGKSAQYLMVRSSNEGRTWSKPKNLTRQLKNRNWILYAPSPQQGITLRDGTLVMVGEGRDDKGRMFSNLMVSRDHGKSWKVGAPIAVGNGECQAVQLNDGSIMLNARSKRPIKYRSVWITRDLGRTWRPHTTHRKSIIEPNCNGSLYRFDYSAGGKKKHVLIFANPHSQKSRSHHTIQVSFDEGRTWPRKHRLLLDEGTGNGYPSVTRVDDEHIGIVYEGSQSHLVFEKISLKELGVR